MSSLPEIKIKQNLFDLKVSANNATVHIQGIEKEELLMRNRTTYVLFYYMRGDVPVSLFELHHTGRVYVFPHNDIGLDIKVEGER